MTAAPDVRGDGAREGRWPTPAEFVSDWEQKPRAEQLLFAERLIDAARRVEQLTRLERTVGDLHRQVDHLGERVAYYRDSEVPALRSNADGWAARAERAEATLERVRALADRLQAMGESAIDEANRDLLPAAAESIRNALGVTS